MAKRSFTILMAILMVFCLIAGVGCTKSIREDIVEPLFLESPGYDNYPTDTLLGFSPNPYLENPYRPDGSFILPVFSEEVSFRISEDEVKIRERHFITNYSCDGRVEVVIMAEIWLDLHDGGYTLCNPAFSYFNLDNKEIQPGEKEESGMIWRERTMTEEEQAYADSRYNYLHEGYLLSFKKCPDCDGCSKGCSGDCPDCDCK